MIRMPSSSTPSSDPAPSSSQVRWRDALAVGALVLTLALALVAVRVVWFDAYWLFREHPPWLDVTGGANRTLDRQTRRAKMLQALDRDYAIALVGSSTVYHGLDPRDANPRLSGTIFNAGISALMGAELPIMASVVASRGHVRQVAIGLDYYMFSRRGGPPPLSPSLQTALGRWNARLGSLFGLYALADSAIDQVAGGDDPGGWTRSGFRITPGLPPALTRQNALVRRRTTSSYLPDLMGALDVALDRLVGLDVQVYLSPVNDAQRRLMSELGLLDDFARWRADAARIAADHRVGFHDLADLALGVPFDPDRGSTDVWLDNLHYRPVLGRRVLEVLGFRTPATSGRT